MHAKTGTHAASILANVLVGRLLSGSQETCNYTCSCFQVCNCSLNSTLRTYSGNPHRAISHAAGMKYKQTGVSCLARFLFRFPAAAGHQVCM